MTKKKVTAPLTYNPGKGRPKEHLAYLNYQEMQALKRLNGNNQERGPRGLPSFPPADATSGSYNSGYGSGGSRPSSGGPGGGMMGGSGSGGPSRTSPSSGRGDVGGRDSGTRDSVGANRPSSSGVSRGDVAGRDGGIRNVAGANTTDKSAINSANRTNTLSAQKSPAFKADTARTVNVGPMGTPVSVKAPPGGKIKGAIQSVKAPQATQTVTRGVSVPAATVKINQPLSPSAARAAMGDVAPIPSIYRTVADADRAVVAEAAKTYNQRFGTNYTSDQFSRLSKTVAGEAAGESDFARAAVANTFVNRAALAQENEDLYGYMGGGNFSSLADQYDAYRMDNAPYRAAVPGTKTYQQGVNAMYQAMNPESTFSKTASPKVLTATHYYNPAVVSREPDWARDKTNFERVDSHLFGTAEASPKVVSKARAEQIARAGTTIVPASSTFEESNIRTPRLRPESQNMKRPPSAGRSAVEPKINYDRVPTEPDIKEIKRLNDLAASNFIRMGNVADIASLSPAYNPEGAPGERMLYASSPETIERMNQVFDRSRGMSYTPGSPAESSYFGDVNKRAITTPSRSYFSDVGDRVSAPPERSPYPRSEYSGYGTTGYSTLSGIPTPDSTGLTGPAPSYGGVLGIAQSGFNALSDALKMPPETAKALRDWGLAKGIEPPRGIVEGAMSLVPDSVADAEFTKAATPFAQSLRDQVVSGVAGLQENYRNALAKAQKSPQQNVPSGVTSEDESPSVDTSTTKISVGPNLGTIDEIVDAQKNLTKQEKDELKRILSEAAAGDVVEFSTNDLNSKIGEARRNIASGESGEVYGPVYVDPEAQEEMRRQDKLNKAGVRAAKTFTGPIGRVASAADALRKVFTGKSTTEATADLKRAYMQASDEQRAALEKEYPNLTKFASDVGETPQLGMDNYTNWADRSGLRGPPDRRGGGENSGIASLGTRPTGDSTTTPTPDTPSTSSGRRPDIYYMWDLGINIPSPSDPNYNQYQTYLAERLAAQRAMGYV